MLALLLVAVSVGVDNFAAAIAIGVSGVDARTRLRVGLVFGAFEAGMPVLGLVIGAQAAAPLGHAARWVGAVLLIGVGGYAIIQAARERAESRRAALATGGAGQEPAGDGQGPSGDGQEAAGDGEEAAGEGQEAAGDGEEAAGEGQEPARDSRRTPPTNFGRLLASGLALSLDNLVVGFALGASHTSIWLGVIVIGAVSAALSLAGLELGARAGRWAGERAEQLAGLLLIFVGVALGTGLLS